MQTFLPYPDFNTSARVLDRLRLGKQRVEVYQVLRTLFGETKGWKNHPAVRMWRGHERALAQYGLIVCATWTSRGYNDSCADKIKNTLKRNCVSTKNIMRLNDDAFPSWLGDSRLHSSHRAALLMKNYGWYFQFLWSERPEINYYWPS